MKVLETEIQIEARPEEVWSILTDLRQYAEGDVKEGQKLGGCPRTNI